MRGCARYLILFAVLAGLFIAYPVMIRWALVGMLGLIGLLLLAVAGWCVYMLLAFPIKIRPTMEASLHPRFTPFVPGLNSPLPAAEEFFARNEAELEALGFEHVDRVSIDMGEHTPQNAMSIFHHPEERCIGMLVAIIPKREGAECEDDFGLQTLYLELVTEFTDGFGVTTNTSSSLGCFPPNPTSLTLSCVPFGAMADVLEVHRAAVAASAAGRQVVETRPEELVEHIRLEITKSYDHPIKKGYFRKSTDGRKVEATIKGAYLMSWKMMPPFVGRRLRANRERNERFFADWKIERLFPALVEGHLRREEELSVAKLRHRWGSFARALGIKAEAMGVAPERIRFVDRGRHAWAGDNLKVIVEPEEQGEEERAPLATLDQCESRYMSRTGELRRGEFIRARVLGIDGRGELYVSIEFDDAEEGESGGFVIYDQHARTTPIQVTLTDMPTREEVECSARGLEDDGK